MWAVEGPEVADMSIEEPEHQVDVVNNETEELEGLEARGLPNPGRTNQGGSRVAQPHPCTTCSLVQCMCTRTRT